MTKPFWSSDFVNPYHMGLRDSSADLDKLFSYPALLSSLKGEGDVVVQMPIRALGNPTTEQLIDLVNQIKSRFTPRYVDVGEGSLEAYFAGFSRIFRLFVASNGSVVVEAILTEGYRNFYNNLPTFAVPPPKESLGDLYTLADNGSGPQIERFQTDMGVPFDPKNYSAMVSAAFSQVSEAIEAVSPSGRLSVFEGPPGTGKTTLIQGLIHACRKGCYFVYIPAHLVKTLSDPRFISVLSRYKANVQGGKLILILEDADECLKRRSDANMGSVAALLNLTDGLLGKGLDLRIVATTNETVDLDPACERPGRLFLRCHVGNLTEKEAQNLLDHLVPGNVENMAPSSVAEVYLRARQLGWKPKAPIKAATEEASTPPLDLKAVYRSIVNQ